jgi:hypothetical protein
MANMNEGITSRLSDFYFEIEEPDDNTEFVEGKGEETDDKGLQN